MTNIMINWKDCINVAVSASALPRQTLFVFLLSHCYCIPLDLPFCHLFNELHLCLVFILAQSFSVGVLIELMHSSKREQIPETELTI